MKQKVLIIDDEALIRRALQRACEILGFETQVAEDGKVGIEVWQKWTPDLVFLDIIMPKLNGFEVLKQKPKDNAKIVLISAYSGDHNLAEPTAYGADLFIPKPFEDIFEVVNRAKSLLI